MIVDGGYLFESRSKGSNWEQTVDIIKDLQSEAIYSGIPWIVTTQQNADVKKKMGREDHQYNIRYGKEWSLAADDLLLLNSNADLEVMRKREILLPKARQYASIKAENDGLPKFQIHWDTETFNFDEVKDDFDIEGLEY
jgi:hypothetical protein